MGTLNKAELLAGGLSGAMATIGLSPNATTFYDLLGDSRLDTEDLSTDPLIQRKRGSSIINQLQYRPTFNNRLRRGTKGAKAGYTSAESLQLFLPAVLASSSTIVFITGMLNDSGAGYTAVQAYNGYAMSAAGVSGTAGDSTTIGGIAGAIAKITAQGRRVVFFNDYPPNTCTAARFAELMAGNAIIQDIASKNRLVTVIDMASILANKTNTVALASGSYTNLLNTALCRIETTIQHPNMWGAMLIAAETEAAIAQFILPAPPARVASRADGPLTGLGSGVAGVTNMLWNSLFMETTVGPAFQGAGSTNGTGSLSSGTVPPGYRLTIDDGCSVAVTTPAGPVGNDLQLVITTTKAGTVTLGQGVQPGGRTDQNASVLELPVRHSVEVDVADGSTALVGVQTLINTNTASFGANESNVGTSLSAGPGFAYSQILVSPTFVIPAGTTNLFTNVTAVFNAAGSATIKLRRNELRRILSAA